MERALAGMPTLTLALSHTHTHGKTYPAKVANVSEAKRSCLLIPAPCVLSRCGRIGVWVMDTHAAVFGRRWQQAGGQPNRSFVRSFVRLHGPATPPLEFNKSLLARSTYCRCVRRCQQAALSLGGTPHLFRRRRRQEREWTIPIERLLGGLPVERSGPSFGFDQFPLCDPWLNSGWPMFQSKGERPYNVIWV